VTGQMVEGQTQYNMPSLPSNWPSTRLWLAGLSSNKRIAPASNRPRRGSKAATVIREPPFLEVT
jgi:hypothetical protein